MNRTCLDLLSSTRDFLARRFLIATGACLALAFGTASPIQAQTTYPVNGTAGFDTGLQRLANLVLDHNSHIGDQYPLGALIGWGDHSIDYGWLVCSGILNSDPCDVYGMHRYGSTGTYTISIDYDDVQFFGNGPHHTVYTTATISPAGDFVILSIGDSIASGEGNPLVPAALNQGLLGLWDDPFSNGDTGSGNPSFPSDELAEWPNQSFPCHRSGFAGPAQAMAVVEQNNPGVRFIHYACSGAKIEAGDTPNTTAQDAVGQLRVARGRLPRIDALIISAGSNSLYGPNSFGNGFGGLVGYCLHFTNDCDANANVSSDLNNSFNSLPSKYRDLAKEINCINPADGTPEPSCTDPQKQIPKLVLITEYMDPTHNQNGEYPKAISCPGFFAFVDQAE